MSEQISPAENEFIARAMALALDFTLLAVMQCFLFLVTAGWFINDLVFLQPFEIIILCSTLVLVSGVSFVFLHIVYFTVFHAWTGQTPGKLIMGIRVVSTNNGLVSPAVAFLRWAGYLVSAIPLGAGFLWAAVDRGHCAWHDRLSGTKVIAVEMT